jgi:hypothetical protein
MREYSSFDSRNATRQAQAVDEAKRKPHANSLFFEGEIGGESCYEIIWSNLDKPKPIQRGIETGDLRGYLAVFNRLVKPFTNGLSFTAFHQREYSGCGSSPTLTFVLWI